MANPLSSENRAYLRLVAGTLLALAGIAAINALIIVNAVGTNPFKPIKRDVASVSTAAANKVALVKLPIIKVNCKKRLDPLILKTKASSARVQFYNCKDVGRLTNLANSNDGDIFEIKKNQWTSDFIQLNEGLNRITAPLGNETQTIEITREVPIKKAANKAL